MESRRPRPTSIGGSTRWSARSSSWSRRTIVSHRTSSTGSRDRRGGSSPAAKGSCRLESEVRLRVPDKIVERGLLLLALSSVAILASITFFIFREGAPLVYKVGLGNFFSTDWHPTAGRYGIALMIVGSA